MKNDHRPLCGHPAPSSSDRVQPGRGQPCPPVPGVRPARSRLAWFLGWNTAAALGLGLLLAGCRTQPAAPKPAPAQPPETPARVQRIQNGVQLNAGGLNVRAQFYADNTVRVVKWLTGGPPARASLVVIQTNLPALEIPVEETAETLTLKSSVLKVEISKADGAIRYGAVDGRTRLQEKGRASIVPLVIPHETNAFSVRQEFTLSPDEGLYGLGQHQSGYMNYRGRTVKLVQANTEAVTPFLISTAGYGILWDNYSKTLFADEPAAMSLASEVGDGIDYYYIQGKSMDAVIAGYRALTGPAPMYGKWAYGYWQSKEHYKTRDELVGVAREYRKRGIPIDNLIQDWNYWDGNRNWSSMVFDETRYPNPKAMVDELHDLNFHLMISIWPGLGPDSEIFKEMDRNGFLYNQFGWAGFKYYDAFNPRANDLYWRHLKSGLYSKGIDAWWIDSTEPDVVNALTKESTDYWMKTIGTNYLGSWARYLNPYSLVMTEALYRHLREENDQKRVYILTRSTFAGQQRAAATTWSGDIGANWDVYRKQISAGLNHCLAGIPYWTFDIGAFVLGSYGGVFSNGGKDPAYQELYTRMFQFGAFCPIFRAHGSETPREIWEFGEFSDGLVKFDQLRYRLLPYLYSLAWQVTHDGYTIMRGLPMDFAGDPHTYAIDDQFLFGPALMVCPVTQPMLHRPPEDSVLVGPENFRTKDGKPGLTARYYSDTEFKTLVREQVETNINLFWYTGWPDFITSPQFSVRWEGKLLPKKTGLYRFHMKSFGPKRILLDGKELPCNYWSVEFYTVAAELEADSEYDLVFETSNAVAGAFRAQLYWKTPEIHAREQNFTPPPATRPVYLPAGSAWTDFWTGKSMPGGQTWVADAPIDKLPLLVRAGSILPLGPAVQYSTEKPADPLEVRIYPGADGVFTLYEDENDGYRYEQGIFATITFHWEDAARRLTIDDRKGSFPGMLKERQFHVVLVGVDHGTGVAATGNPDQIVAYRGEGQVVQF
jgi:alpha-D-xyloside xylohydrolase